MESRNPYGWKERSAVLELDFDESEFRSRIRSVQTRLEALDLDALLVWEEGANGSNVRYLSGFYMPPTWIGGSLVLVGREGDPVLVTSAVAHGEPMHSNIQTTWLRDVRAVGLDYAEVIAAVAGLAAGWRPGRRIGVAGFDRLPYALRVGLDAALEGHRLLDDGGLMKAQRVIKSPAEIALLRRLGAITAAGMDAAMAAVAPGVTESEVAAAAHRGCMAAGAEQMTFGCFVGSGKRGALKNMPPRPDRRILPDQLVVIDLGCKLGGYQSDMSRNVVAGQPAADVAAMVETCRRALDAGKAMIRPGVADRDIVAAMRELIAGAGFAPWDWSICHGYGLDLVETPTFAASEPTIIEAGMCFYVEPMIIPPEIGAICIEDMIVVTEDGFENLTPVRTAAW
ncbi:Xaa-Pro peptidase family protein [Ancylobacter sp. Lp-2]|uniref:M24 family metallopeptidase n=1 Tax=Ancylobacter sp. Lp-2 TaxID=2881339 RepID=UPI001E3B6811|nr:Xaa-Pro peptidase family protein [Ancylobacter sp. Lp-2]MCB4768475.1 Xaa-Pro peptidase family protein [Ancylobacter sp. Lp-2]